MPQFEFLCEQCSYRFTVLIDWAEKDRVRCPRCGSNDLRRIWSAFAVGGGGQSSSSCEPTVGGG
uniref:Zinc ribbon domain-containing protein n=1 Tax=Ammonifex degensii TaxID=42838 RepID=A0A7C1J873_9THEO